MRAGLATCQDAKVQGDSAGERPLAFDVRAIRADEWDRLRSIRLEALKDSPDAFITKHEEALADPQSRWEELAARGAAGDGQTTIIAVRGRDTVAMAVGLWDPDRSGTVMPVVAVFVSPRVRRQGVGARVMRSVHDWGRSKGATAASLWVVDSNTAARGFYEGIGYKATLDRHEISVPPVRWETRMVLTLR